MNIDMGMHYSKTKSSLLAGAAAALLWSAADMLLVGFVPQAGKHLLFSQVLAGQINAELALLMLDAPAWRLFWGVYLATFSVFLYLLAVYGIYRLLRPGRVSQLTALLLLLGYALSPLGHAGFAYIGLLAQGMQHASGAALEAQIVAFLQFEHLLQVHWAASVGASALGWALLLAQVLARRTALPRKAAWLNPLLLAPCIGLACLPFSDRLVAVLIGCASLNIAQLAFFLGVQWFLRQSNAGARSGGH
ncbi:hypothetical protein D8I35_07785 [Corticibacter populi]|uniref:DUF4386 family protein n=1 Tax=Corticibacter populi TaxID=1550736 RepID=A0A3M6QTS5_9BURK|nr:DUF6796 family protein [Corticibacter populi]RMX06428.1 hypothetical protein D8I35_07785 [Corticibacter populi]RZS32023.1 hypothetical protein EV687_2707 [Corticibacter populi]